MKKRSNWFRVSSLLLVLLTVLTVPLLYQNCGLIDGEVGFRRLPSEIGIQIRNGKGTVIANGGDLCLGAATDEESSSVVLSITTSPLTEVYYCRRPYLDNGVWNCNEARSLVSGGSEGVFRVLAAGDDGDRVLELSYENLPAGRYELEISAEGGSEGETPWTSVPVPVSFVVKDCTIATCADTNPSQDGPQQFSCPEGWSYKTSANSLTHPSQDRCCTPPATATCSDTESSKSSPQPFVCKGASVYNQSAATKTNPSDSVCCECRSGYVGTPPNCRCPSGKEKYGNSCLNECRADQERNSEGQCICPEGKADNGIRCDGQPLCSEQITERHCYAKSRALLSDKRCSSQRCTLDECCSQNCETLGIECDGNGWVKRGHWPWAQSGYSETVTFTNISKSTCCFRPRCLQNIHCNKVPNSIPPRWECDKSPKSTLRRYFSCPSGWIFKKSQGICDTIGNENTLKNINCTQENCCAPPATCLDTKPLEDGNQKFPCPDRWSYKTSANHLTSPSRDNCCTPPAATCGDRDPSQDGNQRYPCPEGWSYKKGADDLTSPSNNKCCRSP